MTKRAAAERMAEKLANYRRAQLALQEARRQYRDAEVEFLKAHRKPER